MTIIGGLTIHRMKESKCTKKIYQAQLPSWLRMTDVTTKETMLFWTVIKRYIFKQRKELGVEKITTNYPEEISGEQKKSPVG